MKTIEMTDEEHPRFYSQKIESQEVFNECKKYLLERLDRLITNLIPIKDKISQNKTLENEDWIIPARALRDFMNTSARYNEYLWEKENENSTNKGTEPTSD